MGRKKETGETTLQEFYYTTDLTTEKGKEITKVLEAGVNADKQVYRLLEEIGADGCIPGVWTDFGGISALTFKQTPDDRLFRKMNETSADGQTLYEPRVRVQQQVVLWNDMQEVDGENIVKAKTPITGKQAIAIFGRKKMAELMNIPAKYLDPVDALELLGFTAEEVKRYINKETTLDDLFKKRLFASKRDKSLRDFAKKGEEEINALLEAVKDKTYGCYTNVIGDPQAIKIYKEIESLPVVPQGTLNFMCGVPDDRARIGFFVYENKLWFKARRECTLTPEQGLTAIDKDTWYSKAKEAIKKQPKL